MAQENSKSHKMPRMSFDKLEESYSKTQWSATNSVASSFSPQHKVPSWPPTDVPNGDQYITQDDISQMRFRSTFGDGPRKTLDELGDEVKKLSFENAADVIARDEREFLDDAEETLPLPKNTNYMRTPKKSELRSQPNTIGGESPGVFFGKRSGGQGEFLKTSSTPPPVLRTGSVLGEGSGTNGLEFSRDQYLTQDFQKSDAQLANGSDHYFSASHSNGVPQTNGYSDAWADVSRELNFRTPQQQNLHASFSSSQRRSDDGDASSPSHSRARMSPTLRKTPRRSPRPIDEGNFQSPRSQLGSHAQISMSPLVEVTSQIALSPTAAGIKTPEPIKMSDAINAFPQTPIHKLHHEQNKLNTPHGMSPITPAPAAQARRTQKQHYTSSNYSTDVEQRSNVNRMDLKCDEPSDNSNSNSKHRKRIDPLPSHRDQQSDFSDGVCEKNGVETIICPNLNKVHRFITFQLKHHAGEADLRQRANEYIQSTFSTHAPLFSSVSVQQKLESWYSLMIIFDKNVLGSSCETLVTTSGWSGFGGDVTMAERRQVARWTDEFYNFFEVESAMFSSMQP